MQDGYIKLWRKLLESEIMDNKPPLYAKVWMWLLLRAQHQKYKKLKAGQTWTSISQIQEAMSYNIGYRKHTPSRKEIWKIIEFLRNPRERDTKATTKATMMATTKGTHGFLVTICNWKHYQGSDKHEGNNEGNNESNNERDTKGTEGEQYKQECLQECKNDVYISSLPKKKFTDSDMRLAELLDAMIAKNYPGHKKTSKEILETWANEVRLMREVDNREDIEDVLVWSQKDSFWMANIKSMKKLRKQYETLDMKRQQKRKPQRKHKGEIIGEGGGFNEDGDIKA